MIIRYDLDMDDLLAFYRYHYDHSSTLKRTKRISAALGVLFIFGVAPLIPPGSEFSAPAVIAFAVIASVMFCVLYNWQFDRSLDRQARKLIEEGSTKGVLGQHELEIDEQSVTERTEYNETRQLWRGVSEIIETESHIFMYIASFSAHVVPKARVADGDVQSFFTQAVAYWKNATDADA